MKDLISHTVWCNSKVWLSVKKERERGRGRVTQREREREDRLCRSHYADMYIPLVRCVYDSSPYKALYPLCTGPQSLQIMYYSYMHYAHIMGN